MTHEERFEKIEDRLAEISESLARVHDAQVVAAELQRQSDRRFEDERQAVWAVIRANADQIAITQATLNSLMVSIERFVQGRGGNGQE